MNNNYIMICISLGVTINPKSQKNFGIFFEKSAPISRAQIATKCISFAFVYFCQRVVKFRWQFEPSFDVLPYWPRALGHGGWDHVFEILGKNWFNHIELDRVQIFLHRKLEWVQRFGATDLPQAQGAAWINSPFSLRHAQHLGASTFLTHGSLSHIKWFL